MADDLQSWMAGRQPAVEAALRQQLRRAADAPPALVEAMAYSLLAPGKRLRPVLVLLANEACGGPEEAAAVVVGASSVHGVAGPGVDVARRMP